MANTSDVTVIIDVLQPTPKLGFGKPLILGTSSEGSAYKTYLDLQAVKADFLPATEVYKAAYAIFNQGDDSPAEIAVMTLKTGATPEKLEDMLKKLFLEDWYFLIYTKTIVAEIIQIADAVEMDNGRQFFASTDSKADLTTIKAKKYKRTTAFYHVDADKYPEAEWIGRVGSAPVGSVTWKFKKLTGITSMALNATEVAEIHALGANTYITKAGDPQTSEGKTVSGEKIDVVHAEDYIKFSIQYSIQKLLNQSPKVPYTDGGIAMIESAVKTVLQRAHNQGIIASDADGIGLYNTIFKSRSEVDPSDRAAREYNSGFFDFELAGAIHTVKIKGEIRF